MPIDKVKMGQNVWIAHESLVNLYGCIIGNDVSIGPFVEIQKNVKIGNKVKIQSHSFICEGVTIEDNCYIGHNVTFINDKYPASVNRDGSLKKEGDWQLLPVLVKHGAAIGSGAVIMCGVTIGENAMIGAGAVVTKDVPANSTYIGFTAKELIKRK